MTPRPDILDRAATLADITRCRLLLLLAGHELTVGELCAALQLPQSTVSRHLKTLADGGWLATRRETTRHFYRFEEASQSPAAGRLWVLVKDELDGSATAEHDRGRLAAVLAERRSQSRAFFAESAPEWDRLRDELFGRALDRTALLGFLDPAWTVGDLGCGTGRIAAALAPFVGRVIAVDDSPAMLEGARHRLAGLPGIELRQGSLESLPIADGALDAATLVLALHHLPEPAAALAEVRRTLAPGGRLLVVDLQSHDREELRRRMGHVWLGFSAEQSTRLLRDAGFVPGPVRALPPDPDAQGPALFALGAVRPLTALAA